MTHFKKLILSAVSALTLSAGLVSSPTQAAADSDPNIADIMIVGFNFCPRGWAEAAGQLLPVSSNLALFSLLGTIYGGDGRTTFALPDLRSRVALGIGNGPGLPTIRIGQKGGAESTAMTVATMGPHNHTARANNLDGNLGGPGGKLLAAQHDGPETIYSDQPANRTMSAEMIANTGGGQAIPVQDPYLALTHCIALQGTYPSRN